MNILQADVDRKRRRWLVFSVVVLFTFAVGVILTAVGLFGGLEDFPFLVSLGKWMALVGTILQLLVLLKAAMAKDFGINRPTYDPYTYDTVGIQRKPWPGERRD